MNDAFKKYYARLNDKQKQAVESLDGPVMVIAGPGTGKTQILAMRIANILLKTQVNPSNILALTFTNSGAYEMRKRLLEIIGPPSYQVHIHTFHSFCNEVINTYPEKFVRAKRLNQLDELEQRLLIQQILDELDLTEIKLLKSPYYYDRAIVADIDALKQEGIGPEKFTEIISSEIKILKSRRSEFGKVQFEQKLRELEKNRELGLVYTAYEKNLAQTGRYDYNDMILFVLRAFSSDRELLSIYQEQFQYILLDEFQDTNSAQNEIVKLLGSFYDVPNIFVVGDDEQSIFRFQGASIENIFAFSKNYPQAKVIVLEKNYRSSQKILDSSRAVILNNRNQIIHQLKINKKLISHYEKKQSNIFLGEFSSAAVEDYFVATEIKKLIDQGTNASEIAVLYKEHRDAENLIDTLAKMEIPYQLETGGNILLDPEINKIIRILAVLDDFDNSEALFEIMHYPFFELPVIDIYKISNTASARRIQLFELINETSEKLNLSKPKRVLNFIETLIECRSFLQNNTFASGFDFVINRIGYLNYLFSLPDSAEHLNRLQTLYEKIKALNGQNPKFSLKDFLIYIDALAENNLALKEEPLNVHFEGVRLMTAHKAKGLEFENVFMIHLSDKHWGNARKRDLIKLPNLITTKPSDFETDEEERRLFYVGLTRAKSRIYLTYATKYNESTLAVASKFINELPEKLINPVETKKCEEAAEERLKLAFAPANRPLGTNLKNYLRGLLADFSLSATSFNAYLECPYGFLLNQLIHVPKAKDFSQAYGTAVHGALEKFFKEFDLTLKLPTKTGLEKYFREAIEEEILTVAEKKRAFSQGVINLDNYYDFYHDRFKLLGPPLKNEFSFGRDHVHFGEIPITGIIDKIELVDRVGMQVRIIDYKTSAPKSLNYLLGQTREEDLSFFYQACFYRLLGENDPLFKWKIKEVVFDFISPERGKFKMVSLPIEPRQFEDFKKLLEKTYANILALKFPENTEACKKHRFACEYYNLCQNRRKNAKITI